MDALSTGLYAGLVVGVPVGPVGALALRDAIEGRLARVWALGVGTVVAEASAAVVLTFGISHSLSHILSSHPIAHLLFAGFLGIVGGGMIARPISRNLPSAPSRQGVAQGFGQGFAITLLNPGVVAGYCVVATAPIRLTPEILDLASLGIGVLLGSAIWWAVLIPILRTFVRMGKPEWTAITVRALGAAFIVAALVVGTRSIDALVHGASR